MKGTRAISFLLVFALMASLVVPGFFAQPAKAEGTDNGMRISKTATKNTDGTYTITLEAYATGSKVVSEVKSDVPADIVLVLDQSGSMEDDMGTVSFELYKDVTDRRGNVTQYNTRNQDYYAVRHNGGSGNLWHKLEDGSYVSVSVTAQETASYEELSTPLKNFTTEYQYGDDYYGDITEDCYYYYANNLYEKVGEDSYQKVELKETSSGPFWDTTYTYTYSFADGTSVPSTGRATVPDLGDRAPLYYKTVDDTKTVYTYTYTDASGNVKTIGTSTGASTVFTPTLYKRNVSTSGGGSRLSALKNAVTAFANSVATKAKGADGILGNEDDVDHRIAVVGFACSNTGNNSSYNNYQNTELFIGSNQYKYGTAAQGQYSNAFQSMNTSDGQNNVTASIDALAADGATYVNHGLEIANGILTANPVPEGQTRSRVVVVFTDGVPGYSGYESGVASSAIAQANTSRSNGANVYAVGIFEGADATNAGNSGGNESQRANWFMQNLSDNQGTPRTPSYYLSASDSGTLSNIFQQIANNIESGGSSTTLTDETVIKDIVAPQFTLPEGADSNSITLESYNYIGENAWEKNTNAMGATAEVDGDQVRVTGFNFSENWVGTVDNKGTTEYRGSKLVISFTVKVKDGFLGGNGVETNASAGVYENGNSETPVMTFEKPTVDIPIADVTVDPAAKNVYLLQDVSVDTLKSGATVKVGDVSLDLSQANNNYGLADWQTAYVDITVEVKDASGNVISSDLTGLTDDSTYSITVTVSPKKTEGAATAQTGSGINKINVFKPVLTYQDSSVYYGDSVPADFTANLVSTVWKHGETVADATTMGEAPELTMDYTLDNSKIANGKINTKQDIPVNVTASIGSTDVTGHTTFVHQDCVANENLNGGKFLLHVKTCQLTINKTGGAAGEPYVFTVLKDGVEYTEASITGNGSVTIYELPVGTYSIQEDADWSWRYTPGYSNDVALSKDFTSGTITCTNTSNENKWLNGFSTVVQNIFGVRH